jgi:UDP-N-acetylglucosamine diphosphorylase / glucose-1-phosphate thymidylyltransferase / UDP-N-acetylgalactosamine diphosphorylase / glucosamine-1-phosphate N-acetyltransferase / galactosamine-1-phosphate N-acetyltransferase
MKQIAFFEDEGYQGLYPLTCLRPAWGLLLGGFCIRHAGLSRLGAKRAFYWALPERQEVLRAAGLEGQEVGQAGLPLYLINGRARLSARTVSWISKAETDTVFISGQTVEAFKIFDKNILELVKNNRPTASFIDSLTKKMRSFETKDQIFGRLWELVNYNGRAIAEDFDLFRDGGVKLAKGVHLVGKRKDLKLGKGGQILPGVVLDTTLGPIVIDQKARISPPSYIQGPCYIGPETVIDGARIRPGVSIGQGCKMAGELEGSIIMHHSNKHHDGFLGHAYLGSWVNLGAQTCNSDLKNNYGSITVWVNGKYHDSLQTKAGCYIGDHTKTAIGTLINTGAVIGVACNVFGGPVRKYLPSFSWGCSGNFRDHQLDKALATVRTAMGRRGRSPDESQEELLKKIFNETRSDRASLSGEGDK